MGQLIKRHITPADNLDGEGIKQFNLNFENHLNYLKECVNNLQIGSSISLDFCRYANTGEYLKRNKVEIFQFLFYAHQFVLASSKFNYSEKAVFTIGKKQVEYEGKNKSLSEWRNSEELQRNLQTFVSLAFIMRDEQAKTYYSGLELFYTKRPFYSVASDFLFSKLSSLMCLGNIVTVKEHINFLISFEENEYQKRQLTDNSSYYDEDFKEDNFSIYSSSYPAMLYQAEQIEYLKLPYLAVLSSIFAEDEVGFNKNLLVALEKHKTYYEGMGGYNEFNESRTDKPEGWVSLWLTCACAIAHDRGMKREVASDYIPEWIVKGEFEGLELGWSKVM